MGTLHDGFGATRLPAPVVTDGFELDPGHDSILGLIQTAINSELGEAWGGLLGTLRPDHYLNNKGNGLPVCSTSKLEVTPAQMTQLLSGWPLLSVYRQGEPEFSALTLGGYDKCAQEWSVDYVIGPLKADHIVKLGPFCVAVARVIKTAIMHGYHPDFRGGAKQFAGEFSEIHVKGVLGPGIQSSTGEEQGSGYYGMTVMLEATERTVLDGYAPEIGDTTTRSWETDAGYVPRGTGTAEPMTEEVTTVTVEFGTVEEDD